MSNRKYYVPENAEPMYNISASCKFVDVFTDKACRQTVKNCHLPAILDVDIRDCWDHAMKKKGLTTGSCKDTTIISEILNVPMNPCTGPVCFEGVKAGDILKIDIQRINIEKVGEEKGSQASGSIMTIDFEGVCGRLVSEEGEPIIKVYEIKDGESDQVVVLDDGYEAKIHPMIGVIGVLPKEGVYPTCAPGNWGGNMDTTLIKEGATLYLPVQVDGGMLYLGDAHALMAEGEQYTTGLEADAKVELVVDVIKADDKKSKFIDIDTPFVKVDQRLACIYTAGSEDMAESVKAIKNDLDDEINAFVASAVNKLADNTAKEKTEKGLRELLNNFIGDPLRGVTDDAFRGAMETFIKYLMNHSKRKLDFNEAGVLCGLFGDLAVSQIADDPYRTVRISMETKLLEEYLDIKI